jgi:Mn2+/Fe2+ NRAMP family transporter
MNPKLKNFLRSLGPGILFASTSIGVSHLVQSTRAGAIYGFGLLWAIILANLLKYPFFEYGSRYANVKGESIIDGYNNLGRWALWLYFLITISTMFFVTAAVGAVTAGFLDNLFGLSAMIGAPSFQISLILLFMVCIGILLAGHYNILDSLIKIIGSVLLISTLIAFFLALFRGPAVSHPGIFNQILPGDTAGFAFLIALMGWMPTALDMSAWNSLWTLERIHQTGYKPKLRETIAEFKFSYIIAAVLAPCFLLLGAYLIYGTGEKMPESAAGFAHAVIGMYTRNIGAWSNILIAASAFSIMFGTSIAIFDGYSRSLERVMILIRNTEKKTESYSRSHTYNISLIVVGAGAFLIVFLFSGTLKSLVDVATTISFIVAPVIAVLNYRLVTGKDIPKADQPGKLMRGLSWMGMLFLTVFTIIYLHSFMN